MPKIVVEKSDGWEATVDEGIGQGGGKAQPITLSSLHGSLIDLHTKLLNIENTLRRALILLGVAT